jgi:hypothetical protein
MYTERANAVEVFLPASALPSSARNERRPVPGRLAAADWLNGRRKRRRHHKSDGEQILRRPPN